VNTIKEIKDCNSLKVVRSTLIDDEHWKSAGKGATTLAASQSAHAQVTIDVTKVNCDQFVHHKISEPRLIAAWLSGYYNAKRNNRVLDLQSFEENMTKVTNYCSDKKNFKVPVMKLSNRYWASSGPEHLGNLQDTHAPSQAAVEPSVPWHYLSSAGRASRLERRRA
jgi:HdeA/HdeB family